MWYSSFFFIFASEKVAEKWSNIFLIYYYY